MASGQAKRMGKDKLALPWEDSTVLQHTLSSVLLSSERLREERADRTAKPVELLVVAREPMERYLSASFSRRFLADGGVWCLDPAPRPLSVTIKQGLRGLTAAVKGVSFLPADQVGLENATLARLLACFLETEPDFLVPLAGGPGSPVVFHRRYLPELAALAGEEGGKKVLNRHRDKWSVFPVAEEFFADIDTPQEYERLYRLAVRKIQPEKARIAEGSWRAAEGSPRLNAPPAGLRMSMKKGRGRK
ncbi:molybdenum cofactor guanylyltransferase [Peptococcaceae bacterium CEB3]|nr:molybdenum cofactor guanylyltransferase [Peptococcaceae bacterium CEB3]